MANATWRFSDPARRAMQDAYALAEKHHHPQVLPLHLALALLGHLPSESPFNSLSRSLFRKVIARAHGDSQLFQRALIKAIVRLPSQKLPPEHISRALSLGRVLSAAISRRTTQNETLVAIDHLIFGVLLDSDVQVALEEAHVPKAEINSIHVAIQEFRIPKLTKSKVVDVKFVTDITSLAAKGMVDPVIGRDEEIRRLIIVLSRRKNNNAILVGESGMGKTSIVNGLAQRIAEGDVPPYLMGRKILSLNVRSLFAGVEFQGQFEERIREVLKTIDDPEAMTFVFIDDLHLLMGILNGEASKHGGNYLLQSVLFKKRLHHYIAATTPTDYQTLTEKNTTLLKRFALIPVNEPNIRETVSILRGLKHCYETSHGVSITDDALFETATLAGEYFPSKSLPQSAIDLVDKIAAIIAITRDSEPEELKVIEKERRQLVTEIADLEQDINKPSSHVEEARLELSNIEKTIRPLRETYDNLRAIQRDLLQQTSRLNQFRSIYANGELEGNVLDAADALYHWIPETQAHIEKAKLSEEAAVADLLNQIKDPATKLFFANVVGPAHVRQMIHKLTGRKPIPGLMNLMTGDPAIEWKGKEDSTSDPISPLRGDGIEIPSTSGPSSDALVNIAHESLNSATPIDELQKTQRLSKVTDSSRKEVEREATSGQGQAEPELEGETRYEHELQDNPRAEQGNDTPSNPHDVAEISRVGLEGSSTPNLPVGSEASKGDSAGKPKARAFWRKAKISKFFKSK